MSALSLPSLPFSVRKNEHASLQSGLLWFGAACVLAGAAFSTFLWRRRLRAVEATASPLERAEELIALCERKLDTIEKSVADIKEAQSDINASHNGAAPSEFTGNAEHSNGSAPSTSRASRE